MEDYILEFEQLDPEEMKEIIVQLLRRIAAYESKFGVISMQEENPEILGDLDLSVRSYNFLKRSGKTHVKDFDCLKVSDLMHVRNIGGKNIVEVMLELIKHGFELRKIGTNECVNIEIIVHYFATHRLYKPEDLDDYYFSWNK